MVHKSNSAYLESIAWEFDQDVTISQIEILVKPIASVQLLSCCKTYRSESQKSCHGLLVRVESLASKGSCQTHSLFGSIRLLYYCDCSGTMCETKDIFCVFNYFFFSCTNVSRN